MRRRHAAALAGQRDLFDLDAHQEDIFEGPHAFGMKTFETSPDRKSANTNESPIRALDETKPETDSLDETKLKFCDRLSANSNIPNDQRILPGEPSDSPARFDWSVAKQWEFGQRIAGLPLDQKKSLTDYVRRLLDSGLSPFPATEAKLAVMEAILSDNPQTQKSAHPRSLAARRALLKVRADTTLSLSLPVSDDICAKPRSRRSKRPPEGMFPQLSADMMSVCVAAAAARATPCSSQRPVSRRTAERHAVQLERVADLAFRAGLVSRDVSLTELLDISIQRFWLEHILGGVGRKRQHVRDGLVAYRFFSVRVLGSDSEQAEFARIQQSQFLSPVITDENGHLLHQLLSENILVDLQFLPEKIMTAAYAAKHWRRALTLADTAAALMIELELLLRPGDLTSLDLSEDGTLVSLARRHEQDRRPHLLPETQELLARRAELRRRRKLPLRPLFPAANGGSQLQRAVTARFSKILAEFGYPQITLSRLRDLGTIRLLGAHPDAKRHIRTLLDLKEMRTITRRLYPFLRAEAL